MFYSFSPDFADIVEEAYEFNSLSYDIDFNFAVYYLLADSSAFALIKF